MCIIPFMETKFTTFGPSTYSLLWPRNGIQWAKKLVSDELSIMKNHTHTPLLDPIHSMKNSEGR